MDYKKAYDDLVAKLRDARNGEDQDERFCVVIDQIHPGLKESEDEKIRKAIITHFECVRKTDNIVRFHGIDYDDVIAWLEKQKSVEWSEEDNRTMYNCIHFLELQKKHHAATFEIEGCIKWLESLRPQNHWKPSEEQLRDLKLIADQNAANMLGNNLVNLYNDLQKL